MTDDDLLALDNMGFIPGPYEDETQFLERVDLAKKNFEKGQWIPNAHWEWVREYLDQMFHVKPLYIRAYYSSRGLLPWQAAATWISNNGVDRIQLCQGLKKGKYLKIYSREEILAHEAAHAARSAFNEKRFEEIFAYMTSEKRVRRTFGPLFERPIEVWPLILLMGLGLIFPFSSLIGCAYLLFLGLRLIWKLRKLKKTANVLYQITKDERRSRAILFRLTDREIDRLKDKESIESYEKKQRCLRWRIIRHYLKG